MNRIEKRKVSRTPLWLKVSLFENGTLTKYGLATEFSLDGLLILCSQNGLSVGQNLEIVFDHDFQGIGKHCYFPAEVKRITAEGIAISFSQHDINSFSCIQKIISVCSTKPVRPGADHSHGSNKHEAA